MPPAFSCSKLTWCPADARDHRGLLWRRNLHEELGYGERRVRLRWGGATLRDRHRRAAWRGTLGVLGTSLRRFEGSGFEHLEESCWRAGPVQSAFAARPAATPTARDRRGRVAPRPLRRRCSADLLANGEQRLDRGGTELFVALERLTDAPLPRELTGRFDVDAVNAGFGHRPVYVEGRQRDDAKFWTSALFIRFESGG